MQTQNTGKTSKFPLEIDELFEKSNAKFNPLTQDLEGDVIASIYKNKLDDALYNVEHELLNAPTAIDSSLDVRVSAMTSIIREVVINTPYSFRISEGAADFIGRENLGVAGTATVYLTGVRPYYLEYDDTADATAVKNMWKDIVYTESLLHQFSCRLSSTDPQSVIIKFNPTAAVTNSSAWVTVYDGTVGHAGNFILSLILIAEHPRG